MSASPVAPVTVADLANDHGERRPPVKRLVVGIVAVLVVAAVVAGAVYAVSGTLSPSYASSSTMVVNVNGGSGITDVSVSAANDLASQYAQLANSAPVLRNAEKALSLPGGGLDGKVSGSTVSAQNIIKVTATAGNARDAQRRTDAAANALITYITSLSAKQATRYAAAVTFRLKPIDKQIADVEKRLSHGSQDARRNASVVLANLVTQRQQVQSTIAQNAAGSQPNIQQVTPATGGDKTSPKPGLYAAIALIIVLLVGGRIALAPLLSRRR
jgi:hypothetical protein